MGYVQIAVVAVLRTNRLVLGEFRGDDLDELAAMVADPEQMRFWPRPKTLEEASDWIAQNIRLYGEHGFGVWRVEHSDTSEFVGYCGFRPLALDGACETELVWHVKKTFWRRGIATEAATVVRDAAIRDFGIARLVAIIHPENVGSRRVAEKLGLDVERATTFDGEPVVVYGSRATPL